MTEMWIPQSYPVQSHTVRLMQEGLGLGANRVGTTWIRKRMNFPCERGPDNNHDVARFLIKSGSAFTKFNPLACPPANNSPLAPLRDEVLLIDPCTGQLSASAEADLETNVRHKFIASHHEPSGLSVPSGLKREVQTPEIRPSAITCDFAADKAWNSREIPDSALRANLGGWTSDVKVKPKPERSPVSWKPPCFSPEIEVVEDGGLPGPCKDYFADAHPPMDQASAIRHFIYTSATQRGFEDVPWDTKLPRRLKPAATTKEKMPDPVNQRYVHKRYNSKPEHWQVVGADWNRDQLRAKNDVRKPISFTSPKSGQIPSYSGVVGSENMGNIDVTGENFFPLTMQRTYLPPYIPTTYRPTIPGYAGKAHFDLLPKSFTSLPMQYNSTQTLGGIAEGSSSPAHGRTAPLSRMMTTVSPRNPFLHHTRPALPTY